jgi:DNA polymerase-1
MSKCSSPEAYQLLHDGSLALAQVEHNGIRIDVDYLKRTRIAIQQDCKEKEAWMRQHPYWKIWRKRFGQKAALSSSDQLAHVLFKELNYEVTGLTKKGKASTDRTALEKIDDPFVRAYTEWAELMKADGTFLSGIERETIDSILHPIFNLHIVKTFRSSSEAPNFQNLPVRNGKISKLVRSCFIPRPGRRLVEIDYGGIEVKVAACYHQDPTMLTYIHDPTKDMHRDMAAEIYKCDPSNVNKMLRYVAKNRYVFPEFYGSYWARVAPDLWGAIELFKMTIDKGDKQIPVAKWLAKRGIEELGDEHDSNSFMYHIKKVEANFWGKRFPVYDEWRKKWYKEYLRTGGYRTLTGFYIEGIYKKNDVINHPVQGSAFHCLLWSLIEIQKELKQRRMKTKVVGQIHDSIVGDVVEKEYDRYLRICKEIMTERIREEWDWLIVPLEIEAEAGEVDQSWFEKKKVELN